MRSYLGIKLVEAQFMTKEMFAALKDGNGQTTYVPTGQDTPGYMVRYPDGYQSWSPKDTFEAAYFELVSPTTITEEDVTRFMGEPTVKKLDAKTTLVSVETITGFVQHETSSCVDPANYSQDMGAEIATNRIRDRIWPCLGFALQWAKNGLQSQG